MTTAKGPVPPPRKPRTTTQHNRLTIIGLLDDLVPEDNADSDEILDALADVRVVKIQANLIVRQLAVKAYEDGATYDEIADALGVARPTAWRIVQRTLDRLVD